MTTLEKEIQIKVNIMTIFWSILGCSHRICNSILWIGTMLGSLPPFCEGEPTARFAPWRAIQLLGAKGLLNSDEVFTSMALEWCGSLHISTHASRTTPEVLRLATGPRQICQEFLWTPLLLFLIALDDTLLIFSPLLFSQERDCSSSPVIVYRKREDSWCGRCLGNCMNQSWSYLISGFISVDQVCFLTVFFSFFFGSSFSMQLLFKTGFGCGKCQKDI